MNIHSETKIENTNKQKEL